jgi:hypothetical protein
VFEPIDVSVNLDDPLPAPAPAAPAPADAPAPAVPAPHPAPVPMATTVQPQNKLFWRRWTLGSIIVTLTFAGGAILAVWLSAPVAVPICLGVAAAVGVVSTVVGAVKVANSQ